VKDSFKSYFAQQMEDFIQYKKALGYSRSSYEKFLAIFDRFCLNAFPEERSLTQQLVMQWVRLRPTETANGVKRRMVAMREFGKYLNAIGVYAYVLPAEMIGPFKPFFPYIFSDEELTAFFAATDSITPHKLSPYREYAVPVLFRLLYCCGLRPHEVRLIRCADVDLETGSIYISDTKVHRDRIVVMSPDMLFLCCQYDTRMSAAMKDREYFFSSPKGAAYSVAWVQGQFRKCWKKAGNFRGAAMPRVYDFRHNYATRTLMKWLDEGRDLYAWLPYLSAYMGHAQFSHTAYYIHLLPERLVKTSAIDWARFNDLIPEVAP
jgi:integrase/recombinase XerD